MEPAPKKGTRKGRYRKRAHKVDAIIELYRDDRQDKQMYAANIIQRAWRRWLDVGVFEYYKELIGFKQCGDPSHLMRYIDPREAEFLDAAAGVHIRFRLGGTKFPPSIYYKIFTHRPIVDMCAHSPKDYAKLEVKRGQRGKFQNTSSEDHSDWYKRIENNGWRLLSLRYWKALDPVTANDNITTKEFHCHKILKKQEMEKRRKRRKIEWLKKMYFGKSLQVKTMDAAATVLIQRAAEGLITSLENEGIEAVMEWEVDEMLKWTNALNYEEYVKQWKQIGTSKVSDSYQGFRFSDQLVELDLSRIPEAFHEIVKSHMKKDFKKGLVPTHA
ncbi:protein MFI [Elgaria multicarinata webbii]|uniref:protein MFI n=1 Tax=Elgaria multicarinata webbii TaxID=159646 RepID=UPI002FCD5614